MTLTQKSYLEIDGPDGTATFEFETGLSQSSDLAKTYLMGEQGQYIREIVNQTPGTGDFDSSRRTGYWVDGGAGNWEVVLSFESGLEDVQWGDGSGGTGPDNVTERDASGKAVKAISRRQVLQNWLARSRSDSQGKVRLHAGEYTDGSFGSEGAFGGPMPVAITESTLSDPDPDQGETASLQGTLRMAHVSLWGGYDAPDWVDDTVGALLDAADFIPDA